MTQIKRIVKRVKDKITKMPTCESEMPMPEKFAIFHGKRTRLPRLTETVEMGPIERLCPLCKTKCPCTLIKKRQQYSYVTEGQEPAWNEFVFQRRYDCPLHPRLIEDCWEVLRLEGKSVG